MPNLDKTGPRGQGPRTGRGFGLCGLGMGRGQSCRGCYFFRRNITTEDELANLKEEEKILEEELAQIRQEKTDLESKPQK